MSLLDIPDVFIGSTDDGHTFVVALYALLAHTHDLVDPSWTTRWSPDQPAGGPDLRFQVRDGTVAVTASTTAARLLLEQHGFVPTADGASYRPRDGLDERGLLGAVTAAEAHAYAHGLSARVHLGIPTPADIPASARRRSAATAGPRTTPSARRRTR
ncbi:hypothetical protein ACGF3J_36255 [Streptomyces sp. NPDC048171]|uniref:hypothetical protein n=1 Tax=Streptomyces sp. NPDC048171 TaxID=3365504 RepID=UPI003711DC18